MTEAHVLVRFALRTALFKVQSLRKSKMHRITPGWTWTFNSQKYLVYTKHLPLRPKFWSVSLYHQRFPRYRTFYNFLLTTKKKNETICQIFNFSNFTLPLTNFGRPPPLAVHMNFGEQIWCVLSKEMPFETFTSYGPMLTKTNKKCQNLKFHNSLKNFGRDPP